MASGEEGNNSTIDKMNKMSTLLNFIRSTYDDQIDYLHKWSKIPKNLIFKPKMPTPQNPHPNRFYLKGQEWSKMQVHAIPHIARYGQISSGATNLKRKVLYLRPPFEFTTEQELERLVASQPEVVEQGFGSGYEAGRGGTPFVHMCWVSSPGEYELQVDGEKDC